MSEIITTPIKVALHRKGDNPIFGENVISVSVDDEAGGPFVVLESNEEQESGLRIDLDELEAAVLAARKLVAGVANAGGQIPPASGGKVTPVVGRVPYGALGCVSCCGDAHEIIQWTDAGPRQYGAECSICGRRIAEENPDALIAAFKTANAEADRS